MWCISNASMYYVYGTSIETPRKNLARKWKIKAELLELSVKERDPGYDVPSALSMCYKRSSTVQWAGSGWKTVTVPFWAVGIMLKEPASAPCERLLMRRPIWTRRTEEDLDVWALLCLWEPLARQERWLAVFGSRPPVFLEEHLHAVVTDRVFRHKTRPVSIKWLLVVIPKAIDNRPIVGSYHHSI